MWTTGIIELRTLLSDTSTDRYHFRKRCFGELNGINKRFKTFEFRRVTDFTLVPGVFLNGTLLALNKIASDFPATGEFLLANAPVDGDLVEASYYSQWFTDAELDIFLKIGNRWLASSDNYPVIDLGLTSSLLKYAAAEAYQKMAERWRTAASETYKVEDAPKTEASEKTTEFLNLSKAYREEALQARDEFYTRQGRTKQPLFGTVRGNVQNLP